MSERLTDEELAVLRNTRYGSLPARIDPDDLIGSVEIDPPRDRPDTLANPDEWALRLGPGAL